MVHEDGDRRSPFFELSNPIRQCTEGCDDNMRAEVVLLFAKQTDDANGLDSFACLGQILLANR